MCSSDLARLGRAVWRQAKQLSPTHSAPGQKTVYGGRLGEGAGGATVLRARHLGDVFAGMIREEKTYETATQSQFMTFRAISTNPASFRSDEGGKNWTHPGIEARHLVPEARTYITGLIEKGLFNG